MPSSTEPLNRIYADQMLNHPYGYAVYQPNFASVIKLGSVGYFDPDGVWSLLADLTDLEGLKAAGLLPPALPSKAAPPRKQRWGPVTSKSVTSHNLDSGLSPTITGLPLNTSIKIKFTSDASFGAVLVTAPPVTHKVLYHSSPFADWVKDNGHALLSGEHKEDILSNGLVVVTQTYETSKCAVTAWTEGKSEVFLGFDAGGPGPGNASNSGGWHQGHSASGWAEYEGKENDNIVVFIGGLWFDCRKNGMGSQFSIETPISPKTYGPTNRFVMPLDVTTDSGEKYQLVAKTFGQPLPDEPKSGVEITGVVARGVSGI